MKKMLEYLTNHAYEVVLLGVFLTVIGSVTSGLGAYLAQTKSSQNQRTLINKNDEIAELNKNLSDFVTGGDRFCYVAIPANNHPSGTPGPYSVPMEIVLVGAMPIYDVFIRVNDNFVKDATFDRIIKDRVQAGTVAPGEPLILPYYFTFSPNESHKSFNFFITTRNGFFIQHLDLANVNGHWEWETRVIKEAAEGRKLVFQFKTPQYPATAVGTEDNPRWRPVS